MSGSGQDPSTFQRVSRDQTTRNARVTTNLQVPLDSRCSGPPVSHVGQLYFNAEKNKLYVSVTNCSGAVVWKEVALV
jgi:hypothetical protein